LLYTAKKVAFRFDELLLKASNRPFLTHFYVNKNSAVLLFSKNLLLSMLFTKEKRCFFKHPTLFRLTKFICWHSFALGQNWAHLTFLESTLRTRGTKKTGKVTQEYVKQESIKKEDNNKAGKWRRNAITMQESDIGDEWNSYSRSEFYISALGKS
jgi:hypothetical protein